TNGGNVTDGFDKHSIPRKTTSRKANPSNGELASGDARPVWSARFFDALPRRHLAPRSPRRSSGEASGAPPPSSKSSAKRSPKRPGAPSEHSTATTPLRDRRPRREKIREPCVRARGPPERPARPRRRPRRATRPTSPHNAEQGRPRRVATRLEDVI